MRHCSWRDGAGLRVAIMSIVAAPSLMLSGCTSVERGEHGALELEQVAASPSLEVELGVLAPGGVVLLKARDGVYRATDRLDAFRFIGAFGLLDVVGMGVSPSGVELVDAITGRVIVLDSVGVLRDWRQLETPGRISSATMTPCGWILAGSDGGEGWTWPEKGGRAASLGPMTGVTLTNTGPHVVATEVEVPFRIMTWRCDHPRARPQPFGGLTPEDLVVPLAGLPAFVVGGVVLRTLADLGSDRRVIQVFELGGQLIQERVVELPMGLVAATCRGRVLAVRRFERTEIAIYRWRPRGLAKQGMC
jgi:hypothetical protein